MNTKDWQEVLECCREQLRRGNSEPRLVRDGGDECDVLAVVGDNVAIRWFNSRSECLALRDGTSGVSPLHPTQAGLNWLNSRSQPMPNPHLQEAVKAEAKHGVDRAGPFEWNQWGERGKRKAIRKSQVHAIEEVSPTATNLYVGSDLRTPMAVVGKSYDEVVQDILGAR